MSVHADSKARTKCAELVDISAAIAEHETFRVTVAVLRLSSTHFRLTACVKASSSAGPCAVRFKTHYCPNGNGIKLAV